MGSGDSGQGEAVPIRFRCAYCNQLMGIARRKAGTVVRCPTCSGQVVVPDPGTAAEAGPATGPGKPPFVGSAIGPLFLLSAPRGQIPATDGRKPPQKKAPRPGAPPARQLGIQA